MRGYGLKRECGHKDTNKEMALKMENTIKEQLKPLMHCEVRPALHIEWEELENDITKLLSIILKREIDADIERSDFYYWNIDLSNSPISENELDTIFALVNANDYERAINFDNGFPVYEFCCGLSRKLVTLLLPFTASKSFADDEGVWFLGDITEKEGIQIL
jgi:hypothetical protein